MPCQAQPHPAVLQPARGRGPLLGCRVTIPRREGGRGGEWCCLQNRGNFGSVSLPPTPSPHHRPHPAEGSGENKYEYKLPPELLSHQLINQLNRQ